MIISNPTMFGVKRPIMLIPCDDERRYKREVWAAIVPDVSPSNCWYHEAV